MTTPVRDPGTTGIFSPEQEELRSSARRFFDERFPSDEVRRLMDTPSGFDEDTWRRMADLGWTAMAIPEEFGGIGFGFVELGVLLEEMGRRLVGAPFLSSVVLGANAILLAGTDEQRKALLPGIAEGTTRAALGFTGPSGAWGPDGIDVMASGSGDSWTLDGTTSYVVDGATATLLVIAARTPDGIGLFTVDPDAVTRKPLETLDLTRKQAQITLSSAPAERLGEGDATQALSKVMDLGAVALANEAIGGAQWCVDVSSAFAKDRVQFGRPIGAFQAVKHKCADMLLETETARSTAYYAAWAAGAGDPELPQVASMAKAACSDAFFHAAAATIQIHGGIGFTWEHDAHLYFRRAKSSEIYLGDADHHRELLAERLGV